MIDVTHERLRNLYDAFDRDFDGRLSKPELLQGLAQQGFHNLEGTRAFELLWETCEKITTIGESSGAEEEGGGASPSSSAVGGKRREEVRVPCRVCVCVWCEKPGKENKLTIFHPIPCFHPHPHARAQNRITFAAFKRIVQRLKMELLFLPELHQVGPGALHAYDSRAPTPVSFAPSGGGGGSSGTISSAGSPTASMAGGHGTPSPPGSFVGADGGAHGGYIPAGAFQHHQGGDGGRRGPRSHAFESLVSALRVEYSVLRQGDSRHLL